MSRRLVVRRSLSVVVIVMRNHLVRMAPVHTYMCVLVFLCMTMPMRLARDMRMHVCERREQNADAQQQAQESGPGAHRREV